MNSTEIAEITIAQSHAPLDRIGYGSCGSVWADSSKFPDIDECLSAIVLKRADGLPDRSLENEARMHKLILSKNPETTLPTAFQGRTFRAMFNFSSPEQPIGKLFSRDYPPAPNPARPS